MKPIYILDHYDDSRVRRQRATLDEIRDVVQGRSSERLAYVSIDDYGDIVATPLTDGELAAILADVSAEYERGLRALLDAAVALCRQAKGFDVSLGSNGVVTIWNWRHHDNDEAARVALAWAELHGYEVKRSSPPATGKSWYPDATIVVDGVDVCRIVWDSVEINTDKAIDDEIAVVRAERVQAERDLEAF